MAYEQKDNSGSMFPNDRKEQPNHPDFKGKAMIDGKWYWLSMWLKQGAKGDWYSTSYQPMTPEQVEKYGGAAAPARQQQRPPVGQRPGGYGGSRLPAKPAATGGDYDDSDIPFGPNKA